ncbi:MAG TPA: carboxypeptidase-like regulatory domain-containing protein [Bryobacteraceae bacterium]|nr:carboxypeptidase-like regulatory domain-containing protein [Bryobacteraceae bacterium]
MKRNRKKRGGVSFALLLLALLAPATEAAKKKPAPESYALVSGTVFQPSGYALPNAEVTLVPEAQPDRAAVKVKKMQAVSDARGEFVFRVPPAALRYLVKVTAKGYQGQEKSVSVQGEERTEVTFQLEPESK